MYKGIKRLLDIVLSGIALVVLSPVFLVVYILAVKNVGHPVLFRQKRIGRGNRIFVMKKFRSMTDEKDSEGNLLPEEKRMTKFGATLRNTSLDELPELLSIFKGDMSIIGPRPLPDYYYPYFKEEELVRHSVRGGLLPPDALSGKAFTAWDEELEYDVYYAKHMSFRLDVKIFWMTLKILIDRNKEQYGEVMRPHLNVERAGHEQRGELNG